MSRSKRIITEEEIKKICENYIGGTSLNILQKQTKLQQNKLRSILLMKNIHILSSYEIQQKLAGLEIRNYFDDLDPIQCYVLGLIFGDGCVYYNEHKYKYALTLTSNDLDILNSAKQLFGTKFPITKRKTSNAYNLVINSKHLCKELISNFKLQSPKSDRLIWPTLPDNMYSYFISGLLSTDGCLEIRKKHIGKPCAIEFSYSSNCLDFIENLQKHLVDKLNISITKIKINNTKRKNKNYSLRYSGNQATIILNYIYNNTDDLLRCKRKYDIYQNHLTCVSNSMI